MKDYKDWWRSYYGSSIAIAHILRSQIPDRWLRIHSLPYSKRYAETPDEYSILVTRQNTIATAVLGSQSPCLLLIERYAQQNTLDVGLQNLPQIEGVTFALFDVLSEPDAMSIWYALIVWSEGRFDQIIKAIADCQQAGLLFVSLKTGEAYAPYDGGADLFLHSTARRDDLKHRFSQWVSKHPQGL